MRSITRMVALGVAVAAFMAVTALPALAGSMYMSKDSGRAAQTWWTQVDGVEPGTQPLGNVHIGFLYVFEVSKGRGDVFAFIDDWDCEPGKLPGGGGHFEEEPTGCEYLGSRWAEGYGLQFNIDRKLDSAHLFGQLTVYGGGHGEGGVIGRPMADITWTGVGDAFKSTSTWRYTDGTSTYTDRYWSTSRNAVMSGTLGPMGFDPDLSGGFISSYRSMSKGRTR